MIDLPWQCWKPSSYLAVNLYKSVTGQYINIYSVYIDKIKIKMETLNLVYINQNVDQNKTHIKWEKLSGMK
jgi:hypothetical protein